MHKDTVHFELNEALIHLREVVAELHDGRMQPDDTPELAVQLGHVLDYICMAWNARDMSAEQRSAISQEEHDRMCNTVPNFHAERVLGEVACA